MSNKKQELELLLYDYDDSYYNKNISLITDQEYDAIKKAYLNLCNKEEYDKVPGEIPGNVKRVKHSHPITSLAKVNTKEELLKEVTRLWPAIIQPKIDGLTLVAYPGTTRGRGKFLTRGNGEFGEDKYQNAIKIEDINKVGKVDYTTRMEAYMPISIFNTLNQERISEGLDPFQNPRNAAAGMLNHKDPSKVKGVHYFAYNIVGSSMSNMDQCHQLKKDGFNIIDIFQFDTIEETVDFIINFPCRDQLDYEIDGLVIKNNEYDSLEKFGSTGHHPKNSFAWKFKSQGEWTKLLSVDYQVGRTGKVTPMARVKPVNILGSTISNVTLHNLGIMSALDLSIGCEAYVIKANDVIPAIIDSRNSTDKKISLINKCPICSSNLEEINSQQFCRNPQCYSKLLYNVCHLAKRDALDIEGLSEMTARKIIDAEYIKYPFDIFDLNIEQLFELSGFGQKSAEKLYDAIQKAKVTTLKKFIYAAGIPNIGRSVSEDIANKFGSLEAFLGDISVGAPLTKDIDGVGETLIQSILDNYNLLIELNKKIAPITQEVTKPKSIDKQFSFVITGKLEKPRTYYEGLIKEAGHKCGSSVSKSTDYLVCNDPDFVSSKMDKAKKFGVRIISCEDMEKLI